MDDRPTVVRLEPWSEQEVDNPASNAVCRGAGFELLGARDFAYPPGRPMRCNDWRFDLRRP
ncbi:hypothetical protein ACFVUH_24400 [Kitasatospora sp. NPDC058032]|uniref:hypothetical protein n=1 Tax=Kitasatospora sp. NPDC058032 TaxID=3346307 RepID=UPI0036DEB737